MTAIVRWSFAPLLLRALPVSNLALLRVVAASWRSVVEEFLRNRLFAFDMDKELESGTAGVRSRQLLGFIVRKCRRLRVLLIPRGLHPLMAVENLQQCTEELSVLVLCIDSGNWMGVAPLFPDWLARMSGTLRALTLCCVQMVDRKFSFFDAVMHCQTLRQLRVELSALTVSDGMRRIHTKFLEDSMSMPFLESLKLSMGFSDLSALDVVPQAPLQRLYVGDGNRDWSAALFTIRHLPHLQRLRHLMISDPAPGMGERIMDDIARYCGQVELLFLDLPPATVRAKLVDTAPDGAARWLPHLKTMRLPLLEEGDDEAQDALREIARVRPSLELKVSSWLLEQAFEHFDHEDFVINAAIDNVWSRLDV